MLEVFKRLRRNLKGNPTAKLGLVLVSFALAGAIFAPFLATHEPRDLEITDRLISPFSDSEYVLGTDGKGRDLYTRILYGARTSLTIGILSAFFAAVIGITVGLVAGYYGGWVDTILMRGADVMLAFPAIVVGLIVIAVLGPGLIQLVAALVAYIWVWFARTIRSSVLEVRESDYVESCRALGSSNFRIMFRHVLPNVLSSAIVLATMEIGHLIILETALSFFGLSGMTLSWGYDIAAGRVYLATSWWVSTFPGLACFLTVMGFNLTGDWLRDSLDPKTYEGA